MKIRVNASCAKNTPEGELLSLMHYSGFVDVLNKKEITGFPHNGGEHTLRLFLSHDDIDAFLTLVEEVYGNLAGEYPKRVNAFVNHVRKKIS